MELQPHQQRVVTEKDELVEKLTKLNAFIGGNIYNGLDSDEKVRLAKQACHMKDYLDVLNDRIAAELRRMLRCGLCAGIRVVKHGRGLGRSQAPREGGNALTCAAMWHHTGDTRA